MKVHNFCLTYQKGLFWSGQQTQTLQQSGKTNSFAQQVNIECAIQGKTSNFESSGGKCPKIHVPNFCSMLKNELWRPHKSHTFGRTTKVVLPRLVQSFFVFADELKYFLSERSSPLGLVIFYFSGSGRKILQFYRFPVLSVYVENTFWGLESWNWNQYGLELFLCL